MSKSLVNPTPEDYVRFALQKHIDAKETCQLQEKEACGCCKILVYDNVRDNIKHVVSHLCIPHSHEQRKIIFPNLIKDDVKYVFQDKSS
jgi:hypothetical protein